MSKRVALVTGGGRGIGRAIAISLADAGMDVAITYRSDQEAAEATAQATGGRAYQSDVASFEDNERLVQALIADYGDVDVLVHNAGIASRGKYVADTDPGEPARLMATHTFGPFGLTKLLLPYLRDAERADIVFISSVAATLHEPGSAPYTMAKVAMEALARALAAEEVVNNVHVNIVAPGLTVTEMGNRLSLARGGVDAEELDQAATFGRVARPEDVADMVRYVVSDAAGLLTGQRLEVQANFLPFLVTPQRPAAVAASR